MSTEYYIKNRDKITKRAREHYWKNRERLRAVKRAWRIRKKAEIAKYKKVYDIKNWRKLLAVKKKKFSEKLRAAYKLKYAVKTGKIKKPNSCSRCGKEFTKKLIHGHHEDYSKPLEVKWLCNFCHKVVHGKAWEER